MVVEGVVGPRGDGYVVGGVMTPHEAAAYHTPQIKALRDGGADLVGAYTLTYAEEAIGIARAAQACGVPAALSFTLETDGRLPSGETLRSAVERTDAATGNSPAYYMINCAHPDHVTRALDEVGPWLDRFRALRANASRLSHAELDAATTLDAGDPAELARQYRELRNRLPGLCVLGGCSGTDHRHVAAICEACL
jgi:homocysteine S-methyltransferase